MEASNQTYTTGNMLSDMGGWEPVGARYQKTVINRSGKEILVMLWYDTRRAKWFTGEVYGTSYANVKSFNTLELALQT